jgi:hypothetical protein
MEAFFTYAGQVVTFLFAFIGLLKDASDYGALSKKFGKHLVWLCAFLVLFAFVASVYLTHAGRKQAVQDKIDSKTAQAVITGQNTALSNQIQQMAADRAKAESGFRDSFSQLSQKVANLQTKAATAGLTKELSQTREELRQAEAKFAQPKATVVPSLWTDQESQIPVRTALLKSANNAVTIEFFAFNKSDVSATNGSIFLRRCIDCEFAREPEGFNKIEGVSSDREFHFVQIYAHAGIRKLTAEIVPPKGQSTFQIDISVACQNCPPTETQHFFIGVIGPPPTVTPTNL